MANNMFGNVNFKLQTASLTMDGKIAVKSTNGTYCTVDEKEHLIEVPVEAIVLKDAEVLIPTFVDELTPGDYIYQDNDFFKVLNDGMAINFSNGMITRLAAKQNLFMNKMTVYRPIFTDFTTVNPMMLAMLGGNGKDAMKSAMMMQMASGKGIEMGEMNPMMLAMCMGDDDDGDNSGFKMMMIMQMMAKSNEKANEKSNEKSNTTETVKKPTKKK